MSRLILEEHRRTWDRKPVLGRVYAIWFDALLQLAPDGATVLEIGTGPGFLAEYARCQRPDLRWIASDLVPTRWNDLVTDALHLPLGAGSIDLILGLDVIHHLSHPARLFEESARVLRPGGRLAAVEPWVTPLSYPVYRFLHQEGCTLGLDPWEPFAGRHPLRKEAMDGDAACVWKLVGSTSPATWQGFGLRPPAVSVINGFAYLLSLGFKERSLLPGRLFPVLRWLDDALLPLARWLGMRAVVVWEKPSAALPA